MGTEPMGDLVAIDGRDLAIVITALLQETGCGLAAEHRRRMGSGRGRVMRDMSIYEERDGLLTEVERLFKVAADALDRENAAKATTDGLHAAIGRLNGHLVQSQEMAQHTNNAVEDAFGVKPSNEPDENHLALIEAAGYRLMRAEATIERVLALMDDLSVHDAESSCRCCGGYSHIRAAIAGKS